MVSMENGVSSIGGSTLNIVHGGAPTGPGGKPIHTLTAPPPGAHRASRSASSSADGSHPGASSEEWPLNVSVSKEYSCVRLKGQGITDELSLSNELIRETIQKLSAAIDMNPALELKAAETEAEQAEALKLYRDMNHLSLAGGITCESVINHVQSHTVNLYFNGVDGTEDAILVTAATFSMRNETMMLRLLATHPRMTRKGFGRVTVHFLKELCRTLRKTDILVYTYPSSSPFYKALHFRHTNPGLQKPTPTAPATESAADAAAARDATRDARRVFSAKENEMICYIQPTMEQVLEASLKSVSAHPYACTRRRAAQPAQQPAKAQAPAPAPAPAPAREKKAAAHQQQQQAAPHAQRSQKLPRPPPRERVIAPPRERASHGHSHAGSDDANGTHSRSSRRGAPRSAQEAEEESGRSGDGDGAHEASDDTAPVDDDDDDPDQPRSSKRKLEKNEYHVERIVGVRSNAGELQYLIKWKGWQSKFNTWEPLHHLKNLQSEIDAFEGSLKAAKFS